MMKRRNFLKAGGALSVSFLVAGCLPVIPKRPDPTPEAAVGWISHVDGRYTLSLPRAELGQNIATAMKQVACDELGAEWEDVDVELHVTDRIGHVRATVGSDSVKDYMLPLAQACATLREALVQGRTAGDLTADARPMEELRAFSGGSRFVGRRMPLVQAEEIVAGKPLYASDVRRPGMAYGRVLRAASSPEVSSRPAGWDAEAAVRVKGFVAIVEDDLFRQGESRGLGIVAETPGALDRIADALAMKWEIDGGFEQQDIDRMIDIDPRLADGSLSYQLVDDSIDREAAWDIDLRLDIPLGAHAPMEPRAAVAEFKADALELWAGTQDAFYVRDVMVRHFDLDEDRVAVHSMRVGGAFGGKTICTVELEAAVLAHRTGRPVKVQWTRAQEYRQGFHRSPSSHRLRVRLKDGKLSDWWHGFSSGHILFTNAALPPWMQRVTDFIGDKGVARGAIPPYRIPRRRIEHDLIRLPVLTGPWRGLGAGPNALAVECAIDEAARKAGGDSVAFRLEHIEDPRLANVLKAAEAAAGPKPAPGGNGRGRGFACGIYKDMSYAAVAADVTIDADGNVHVERLCCVHDCGRVINPDQVRAQCEGNLVWGLAMALSDALPVANGGIDAENFGAAAMARFEQIPPMKIELVEGSDNPTGAGETAIVAASGAILNAIREASGVRITRLPVAPDELMG